MAGTIQGPETIPNDLPHCSSYSEERLFAWIPNHEPVQRLPNEIISYIFVCATHRSHGHSRSDSIRTSIIVSQVCHRWRNIALGTSSLWTTIIMTHPASRTQLSRNLIWLVRSRQASLDILLDFRDPSWDWEEDKHSFGWQDMESVIRLLLPQAHRWQYLELLTDTWAPIFAFLWHARRIRAAPLLQRLTLARCNEYYACKGATFQPAALKQPISLFGSGVELPHLRMVSLVGVHVDWSTSGLRGLVGLDLKYHAHDVMPSLAQFTTILAGCPSLEQLSVLGWGPQFDAAAATNGEQIGAVSQILHLPRVRRFSYGFVDVDYALQLLAIFSLPALEDLTLEDIAGSLNPMEYQDASPVVEKLVTLAPPSHAYIPLAQLRSVSLHIRASKSSFSRFLHACESLQTISISGTENAALALLPSSTSSTTIAKGALVPCPSLESIYCRYIEPRVVLDVVASRAYFTPQSCKIFVEEVRQNDPEESWDATDED